MPGRSCYRPSPYKMLTLSDDDRLRGDQYADFLETVGFLHGRERAAQAAADLDAEMRRFRGFLQRYRPARGTPSRRGRMWSGGSSGGDEPH